MYTPINDRLIVTNPEEKVTESGIIVTKEKGWVMKVEVVNAPSNNRGLIGKEIVIARGSFEDYGDGYGSVKLENVMSIKENGDR